MNTPVRASPKSARESATDRGGASAGAQPRGVAADAAEKMLMQRVALGDERALGELYDRCVASLYTHAMQLLGDADESADVIEDTFWQAWRQAARYDEARGTVAAWLHQIARSRALDRCRARRRRNERELLATDAGSPSPVPNPAAEADAADQHARVIAALTTLPAAQREVLWLAYYRGLSQSEIARATGEPLGTVKTRVRLALCKLKDSLAALRDSA